MLHNNTTNTKNKCAFRPPAIHVCGSEAYRTFVVMSTFIYIRSCMIHGVWSIGILGAES